MNCIDWFHAAGLKLIESEICPSGGWWWEGRGRGGRRKLDVEWGTRSLRGGPSGGRFHFSVIFTQISFFSPLLLLLLLPHPPPAGIGSPINLNFNQFPNQSDANGPRLRPRPPLEPATVAPVSPPPAAALFAHRLVSDSAARDRHGRPWFSPAPQCWRIGGGCRAEPLESTAGAGDVTGRDGQSETKAKHRRLKSFNKMKPDGNNWIGAVEGVGGGRKSMDTKQKSRPSS